MAVPEWQRQKEKMHQDILGAQDPFDILALTLKHSSELDAVSAVGALDAISRHPQRKKVERDMRFSKLIFDMNFMLHSGHRQFRPKELARCAMAFASLGIKHPSMMYCIGAEVIKKVAEFKASELVTTLLAFALANILDRSMMEAVTTELTWRVSQCTPRELGEVAWALAILRYRSARMMAAISDMAHNILKGFTSVSLAQVVWSLDALGFRSPSQILLRSVFSTFPDTHTQPDRPELLAVACLLGKAPSPWEDVCDSTFLQPVVGTLVRIADGEAISAKELYTLSSQAPHLGEVHTARALQPVGVQVTHGRREAPSWAVEARELLGSIFDEKGPIETFPMTDKEERVSLPIVDKETYARNMADFGVDNFGKIGGRCLLNQIGIGKANENWAANAKQYVNAWADGVGKRAGDWKANTVHRRIYVFSEYHFASTLRPYAPLLEGCSFQLNGLRQDPDTARRPWLCAVPLPISKWVDRTLCAEFQLLAEVCDMINRTGIELSSPELRHSVYGLLQMYLSEPSCVSCVGAMKQFQTLFPGVDMLVEFSSVVEPLMARTEMDLEARQRAEEEEATSQETLQAGTLIEEQGKWKDSDDRPD
mmetsp:Transcript_154492/g.280699  ORF Transcript_154492/g.280699 Transcript_154492/m.280699 type:complete len:596 (-) Transcript_154492:84-1871(-)